MYICADCRAYAKESMGFNGNFQTHFTGATNSTNKSIYVFVYRITHGMQRENDHKTNRFSKLYIQSGNEESKQCENYV